MSSLGIFNKETKTYQKVAGTAEVAVVDSEMSGISTNTVQNKVIKKYVDDKASENVDFSTSTSKLLNGSIEAPLVLNKATRNLLNPTLQTITQDGITCTNNGDGTYTLNGTCSVNSGKTIIVLTSESMKIDEDVKFICCTQSGSRDTFRASVDYDDGTYSVDYGEGALLNKGKSIIKASMIVDNGVTVNNLVFKPMITTDLEATIDDFVPYSGYDIKTCGKNLLNPTLSTTTKNGITCTNNGDGTYTLSGTSTKNGASFKIPMSGDMLKKHLNEDLRLVGCPKGGSFTTYKMYIFIGIGEIGYDLGDGENRLPKNPSNTPYIEIQISGGTTVNNLVFKPMLTTDLNAGYDDYEPYTESTIHIDSSTEFPLLGLKSFDGETNIISPGNVEVTYAKSDNGAAILGTLENKLDKDNVVNNQSTTVEGYALDARQANPNVEGSLGAQIKALNDILNSKKVPTFECNDSIFENSYFIFPITDGDTELITPTTEWDANNGGHRIHFMNTQSAKTSFSADIKVPAHSVVLIDLMSLNEETIVVMSNTLFYNNTDNEVTKFIQCYIKHSMANDPCTINMYPIIIKNI